MITLLAIILALLSVVAPVLLVAIPLALLARLFNIPMGGGDKQPCTQKIEDEVVRAQWRYDNIWKPRR